MQKERLTRKNTNRKRKISGLEIKIYSTALCPHCICAKKYFSERGMPFKNIDAGADEAVAKEILEKCGKLCVPVIEIDGNILVGFQKEIVDALIKSIDF